MGDVRRKMRMESGMMTELKTEPKSGIKAEPKGGIKAEPKIGTDRLEEQLDRLVDEYTTKKQMSLIQMKKGIISRETFLNEAREHIEGCMELTKQEEKKLMKAFEQYIFGYSRLSPLIDDKEISDIRIIGYDNIRVKRLCGDEESGEHFKSECDPEVYGYGEPP